MSNRIRELRATNRIREQRIKRGMAQSEVASVIGCSTQTISKLERGDLTVNEHWLRLISAALRVPKASLLDDGPVRGVPGDSDIVKTDLERLILRFFRNLPPKGQDDIIKWMSSWSSDRLKGMAKSV